MTNLQVAGQQPVRKAGDPTGVLLRATGLGYVVLDFVGSSVIASLPGAPNGDDPNVAPFLARHETTIGLMAWLIGLSAVLLAVFATELRRHLKPSILADVAAVSGVMAAVIIAVYSGVLLTSVGRRTPEQAEILWDLTNAGLVATLPAAAMVLSVSLAARHTRSRPTWIWRTGVPLAMLCLIPYLGWVNLKLFPIWVAALSISLLRNRHSRSSEGEGWPRPSR